jgi:RHS repeat-associated protein
MTSDNVHSYTYDAENRVVAVDGGATATYTYDANGRRVQKIAGGATTEYLYDLSGNVVADVNGSNILQAAYSYLGDSLFAEYAYNLTLFIHKDHLGSTRVMTSLNRTIYDSMDYLPYGEQISGGSTTTHKFTGKERDAESGLDDFEARYYGSTIGRFVSVDVKMVDQRRLGDPQLMNMYAYCRNNPLRLVDPDGADPTDPVINITHTQVPVSGRDPNEAAENSKIITGHESNPKGRLQAETSSDFSQTSVKGRSDGVQRNADGYTATVETSSVQVVVNINVKTASWTGYDGASPDAQKAWDDTSNQVKDHEEQHVGLYVADAKSLQKDLEGVHGTGTGKTPQEAMDNAKKNLTTNVNNILNQHKQDREKKDNDLDHRTDHGNKKDKEDQT